MHPVGVAEAKARLSQLLAEVELGETIEITKRGKVVAMIVPVEQTKQPMDVERLRRHLESLNVPVQSTEESIREWRDDERY